jgi:hypothetical protein
VLIELNLMESPWAYSVMAITILIDAYLLYIFFTVQHFFGHDRTLTGLTIPSLSPTR